MTIRIVCPADKDRNTKQQGPPCSLVLTEACRNVLGSSQSPPSTDSFMASLGGLDKERAKCVSRTLLVKNSERLPLRTVGLVTQHKAEGGMIPPSYHKLLSGKHILGTLSFSGITTSVFWKDKPVGGALSGLTGCESLCLQCYSGYPVNWAKAIRLPRNKTSVFTWASLRMLPEGEQLLKRVPLPLHHLMEVKQVTQARQLMI